MLRRLAQLLALATGLLAPALAGAQPLFVLGTPLTGDPIGAGVAFNASSRPLYVAPAASLQFNQPFTISLWVKNAAGLTNTAAVVLVNSNNANASGFYLNNNGSSTSTVGFPLQFAVEPSGSLPDNCSAAGHVCTRASWVNDGGLHNVVVTYASSIATVYVDGVLRDQQSIPGSFTPSTIYWVMGAANTALTLVDVRVYTKVLSTGDISRLNALGHSGLVPTSGVLATNLAAYWPMSAGTIVGNTVQDVSGNGNDAIFDVTAPTVAVTAPANGATVTGTTVTLTASCSDNIGCASVRYQVDGYNVGTLQTVSPYTATFDSTLYLDGSHAITAVATDPAGNTATSATVTVTASNGIAGVTYFVATGACSDSNPGTSSAAPWCTPARANAGSYRSGDTLSFKAGDTWSITSGTFSGAGLSLRGAGTGLTGGQNLFTNPLGNVRVTTYGGGTCNPIAGVTSGCATFTLDASTIVGVMVANGDGITVEKMRVIGQNASAIAFTAGTCFYAPTNAGTHYNVTFQNNDCRDVSNGVYMWASPGVASNFTALNNYIHGTALTTPMDNGIWFRFGGMVSSTIQGNWVENIGGHTPAQGAYNGGSGNGILIADGASAVTSQFNVVKNFGRNTTTCGGPAGNWAYNSANITIQFNESYGGGPTAYVSGCDWDGFDLDGGVRNSVLQYNYSHNNAGYGLLLWAGSVGGNAWGPNTVRYNVSENDASLFTDGSSGSIAFAASSGVAYIYNNTVWNANPTPGNTIRATTFVYFACPSPGSIIANNLFAASRDNVGTAMFANMSGLNCNQVTYRNNWYWAITGGTPLWQNVNGNTVTSLASWQAFALGGDVGAGSSNPMLLSPGLVGPCDSITGPQPCPAGYALTAGSPLIGTGFNLTLAPWSLNVGTRDYYGTTIPNGVGSGYNIGADGAHH